MKNRSRKLKIFEITQSTPTFKKGSLIAAKLLSSHEWDELESGDNIIAFCVNDTCVCAQILINETLFFEAKICESQSIQQIKKHNLREVWKVCGQAVTNNLLNEKSLTNA